MFGLLPPSFGSSKPQISNPKSQIPNPSFISTSVRQLKSTMAKQNRAIITILYLSLIFQWISCWALTATNGPALKTDRISSRITNQQPQDVYLLSLQWTPDDCISKPVRDVWKWKDAALGDGRDFFVPKPKTIQALQDYLVKSCSLIDSCSVISNCARLEILLAASASNNQNATATIELLRKEISRCLVAQNNSNKQQSTVLSTLTQSMDWPQLFLDLQATCTGERNEHEALELAQFFTGLQGLDEVLRHLSLVSAGMASRPRRPDRPTIFRPFSSRDAHILLQLKRTKEVSAPGRLPNQLLEYALRAGKAARNSDIVPELLLLKPYGTGDTSRYSTDPPKDLLEKVQTSVLEQAIEPLIQECFMDIQAKQFSTIISQLRQRAESLSTSPSELKHIRERLHQPTLELRKGNFSAVDPLTLLEQINEELQAMRQKVPH